MATVQQKLITRMRAEGLDLPEGTCLFRTYASKSDLSCGAWSWHAAIPGKPSTGPGVGAVDMVVLNIGSQYSMLQLLLAEKWFLSTNRHGEISIDVEL